MTTERELKRHGVGKTWASHLLASLIVLGGVYGAYADAKADIRSNTEAIIKLQEALTDPVIGVHVKLTRIERITTRLAIAAGVRID